jgi:hypothetical protein
MQSLPENPDVDPREFTDEELRNVLKQVGEEARRKAFAAGKSVTVLEGNHLVRIWGDGRKEIIVDRAAARESA